MLVLGLLLPTALAAGPTEITSCTTITESGSYVLANNLAPAAPGDCIVIAADYVTLDLRGFTIRGVVAPRPTGRTGTGITTSKFPVSDPASGPVPPGSYTGFKGITVRDGSIVDFQGAVRIAGSEVQIERIRSVANSGYGIVVSDCAPPYSNACDNDVRASGSIRDCFAARNGTDGIHVDAFLGGFVVTGNVAVRNKGDGIWAICPNVVVANVANTINLFGSPSFSDCTEAHNATP
jgi:hypothetical protein